MSQTPQGSTRCEREAWLGVASWTLLIFATVPVVGAIQEWITDSLGPATFLYLTIGGLAVGLAAGVVAARTVLQALDLRATAWLVAVAAIAVAWAVHLRAQPQEAVHLIEYGVLGLLLSNALRHRVSDPSLFLQATLIGAMIGIADELVQWATPGRFFDFRDIWLNAGAVGLTQVGLFKGGILPASEPISSRSVRPTCRLAVAFVALFGVCLSMTPAVVETAARVIPPIGRLIDHEDVIAEFGHRHVVTGIGVFKSRFTLAELAELDRTVGATTGKAIRPTSHGGLFPRFLESASRARYPFAREARLHINSRNRNLRGCKAEAGLDEGGVSCTRAVRENRILEAFFPQTVEHSRERLPERRARALEARSDADAVFYSKVDRHLITVASQAQLIAAAIAVVLLLVTLDVWINRSRGRDPRPGP